MTTRDQELEQHRRWRLKPQFASVRTFDQLLENEFRPREQHRAWEERAVRSMVSFAAVHTPYYAKLFQQLGLRPEEIDGPEALAKLPILSKFDVIEWGQDLRSRSLPPGEKIFGKFKSSGTTGRPVSVLHTASSNAMFTLLRHRSSRWHGLDPARSRVDVRPPRDVSQQPDGSPNPRGVIVRHAGWRYLGTFFETGPEYAFNNSDPIEQQVTWLRELRPHYAMSDPGIFEEWLLASEGRKPVDSLEVLIGVGSQLSPSLRTRLEQSFRVPIHQSYGLNEIGMVAVRCAEGRYHVHTEHCFVEIVRDDGQRCEPGETGRLLVTGLRNHAMPLIRYDTGDLAQPASGPCPCGRTLPSFGEIAGRYRRFAGLPAGTRERFRAVRQAVESYPADELTFLRGYQIHQDHENRFTLRVRTVAPIPEAFRQSVLHAWAPVAGTPPSGLAIVAMADLPRSPSGKVLDFASDLYSDAYAHSKASL